MRYLLTLSQLAIYANDKLLGDRMTCNLPLIVTFGKPVSADKLKEAVEKAVSAHPALSCIIENNSDGQPCLSESGGKISLECHNIKEGEFEQIKKQLIRPFRLDETLCRFELYNAPDKQYFFLDIHHIISDLPSLHNLCSEIAGYMNDGSEIAPEEYSVFSMMQDENSMHGSEEYKNAEEYFGKLLSESETDCLPLRDVYAEKPESSQIKTDLGIDCEKLSALRKTAGVSNTAFFASALGLLLCKYNYSSTSIFAVAEQIDLVDSFHGRKTNISPRTVIECFTENARRFKDLPAVVSAGRTITYDELYDITGRLAQKLRQMGAGKEKTVGIIVSRNEFMPVCALGALRRSRRTAYLRSAGRKRLSEQSRKDNSIISRKINWRADR